MSIEITKPAQTLHITHVNVHITGNPALSEREAFIEMILCDEDNKFVESKYHKLTGEAFNTFYSAWSSDRDLYTILQAQKLIPENVELPQGDQLNV
jgi:hypothetical protein